RNARLKAGRAKGSAALLVSVIGHVGLDCGQPSRVESPGGAPGKTDVDDVQRDAATRLLSEPEEFRWDSAFARGSLHIRRPLEFTIPKAFQQEVLCVLDCGHGSRVGVCPDKRSIRIGAFKRDWQLSWVGPVRMT